MIYTIPPDSTWTGHPRASPRTILTPSAGALPDRLKTANGPLLARGLGRSYSDVCLNGDGTLILTRTMDRILEFDPDQGRLRCEAGVTLDKLVACCGPQGWLPPVMPGTRFVTVGGAIANDVHGKNHPAKGSFGHHVRSLHLLRSNGTVHETNRGSEPALFAATLGGLGLTGVILEAELQLEPLMAGEFLVTPEPVRHSSDIARLFEAAVDDSTSKVIWLDGTADPELLGTGVALLGAPVDESGMPDSPPRQWLRPWMFSMVSPFFSRSLVKLHNRYYRWRWTHRKEPRRQGLYSFLFPLDAHAGWPRIYGPGGFVQYQCRFPKAHGQEGLDRILSLLASSQLRPYLFVVKEFGDRKADGMLSFPKEGWTIAMDFPRVGGELFLLLRQLDRVVMSLDGSLYPAKDPRMTAEMFEFSFPLLGEFRQYVDPGFSSDFWRRVQEHRSGGDTK